MHTTPPHKASKIYWRWSEFIHICGHLVEAYSLAKSTLSPKFSAIKKSISGSFSPPTSWCNKTLLIASIKFGKTKCPTFLHHITVQQDAHYREISWDVWCYQLIGIKGGRLVHHYIWKNCWDSSFTNKLGTVVELNNHHCSRCICKTRRPTFSFNGGCQVSPWFCG